jgi:hypothetical protein
VIAEVMCFTPVSAATASSTRWVTCFSSSDGEAPACVTVIDTSGKSIFGKRSTGSERKLSSPKIRSTMNSTSDGTGCRIAQADMFRRRITWPR